MHERKTPLRLSSSNGKLIPRDIDTALGKLPPQDLDLEQVILGAIMLEKPAIEAVNKFLRPDHFYSESHKEIYRAILALNANKNPIDMLTVVDVLRKTDKIEAVGGAYYISGLTSKVSSAANIEYHSRIIVEMSIKRSMIELASKIHQEAYGDSDCFELLEEGIKKLQHLHESSLLENTEEKLKKEQEARLICEKPPAEIPLICITGIPIATLANHSLILGKKKSRKTLFITWLIQQYFLQNKGVPDDVIIFDTEQGKSHVWNILEKIRRLTGHKLPIYFMRGMAPAERRDFIKNTVKFSVKKPKIIVIDGVRDLMSNINDADETTEVIVWLETLLLEYNVHIMEILHLNKTDNNARGHIGSELLNKAQVTIELEKDEKTGVTIVKCESSREKDFETFSFTHGIDDLPEITGMPVKGVVISEDARRDLLNAVFKDGPLSYANLVNEMKLNFCVGKTRSEQLIREFKKLGWIIQSGNARDPKAMWKLLISENGHSQNLIPYEEAVKQAELFIEDDKPEDMPF